jgi:SAM-dependent methyltransferase
MSCSFNGHGLPSAEELHALFCLKYGSPEETGWAPRRRYRHGYYLPADIYEAVVAKHIVEGCRWVDVGGGSHIFPDNPRLVRSLVSRCSAVVGVDPSENVEHNELVHQRFRCLVEDFQTDRPFDVATLRMVVEHVPEPATVVRALRRLLRPGGVAIVLTVNLWSPITLVSRATPFAWHHPLKKLLWGGEEKDTFPVQYRMNTRRALRLAFEGQGFRESAFAQLDDLSTFGKFNILNCIELAVWRFFRGTRLRYPESCLLGVYTKCP